MIELVLRIGFSLLIVFGLMWLLAKAVRRPLAGRRGAALSVLARQQLSRSASIAVIQVVDRALVVGVTDHQVTLLTETDLAAIAQPAAPEQRDSVRLNDAPVTPVAPAGKLDGSLLSPAMWRQAIDFLRERTVRR